MKLTKENLIEIEDYIDALDEIVGLKRETIRDIRICISKEKDKLNKTHKDDEI